MWLSDVSSIIKDYHLSYSKISGKYCFIPSHYLYFIGGKSVYTTFCKIYHSTSKCVGALPVSLTQISVSICFASSTAFALRSLAFLKRSMTISRVSLLVSITYSFRYNCKSSYFVQITQELVKLLSNHPKFVLHIAQKHAIFVLIRQHTCQSNKTKNAPSDR